MRIKSFFAESIEAAMAQAGKELGADAMLMNSRRTEPDLRHLGLYEVVCAVAPGLKQPDLGQPQSQTQSNRPSPPAQAAGLANGGSTSKAFSAMAPGLASIGAASSGTGSSGSESAAARTEATARGSLSAQSPANATNLAGVDLLAHTGLSVSTGAAAAASGVAADSLALEMTRLRQQMESLRRLLGGSGSLASGALCSSLLSGVAARPELSPIFDALNEAGLSTHLAQDILLRLSLQLEPSDSPREAARLARLELASFILTNPTLGSGSTRIVALIGPPGSGKTTSLVKLAIRECLARRQPCSLVTIDTLRIAGADQLRCYAGILGVPFQVMETPAAMVQAFEKLRPNETVFIDTPGFAAADMEDAAGWAEVFAAQPGLDVHLVLPASMRAPDQERIADRYDIFSPRKLLFTKLDETEALGGIINLSLVLRKPISFLSSGPQIPEDLRCAEAGPLADQVLQALPQCEAVAAKRAHRVNRKVGAAAA